jgi:hypothetical protein
LVDGTVGGASDDTQVVITGALDLGDTDLVAATDSIIVVNLTAGLASSDALETAFEYGGSAQLTAGGATGVGATWLAVYDDTVDTYIAMVTNNVAVAADGWFGAGSLTATNLVKLSGQATAESVVESDILYV